MISKYFGTEVKMSTFLFKVMLVIILTQQIYFPQQLKYLHLALLFIILLFLDIYREQHRRVKKELAFLSLILLCGIASVIESVLAINLGLVYLLSLSAAIAMAVEFIALLIKDSKNKANHYKLSENHIKAIKKSLGFVLFNFYSLMAILVFSFAYNMYQFIKIIL